MGILTIGDIVDTECNVLSKETIEQKWNINCNFLFYLRLKKQIQSIMIHYNVHGLCSRPQASHILYRVDMGSDNNKNVYSSLVGSDISITGTIRDKWSESLNDEVSLSEIQSASKNAKKILTNSLSTL